MVCCCDCQLLVVCCVMFAVWCCLLCRVCCLLFGACCLWLRLSSFVVGYGCVLRGVCCRCLPFGARRCLLLFVGVCGLLVFAIVCMLCVARCSLWFVCRVLCAGVVYNLSFVFVVWWLLIVV